MVYRGLTPITQSTNKLPFVGCNVIMPPMDDDRSLEGMSD